jgi:hypothetical protein
MSAYLVLQLVITGYPKRVRKHAENRPRDTLRAVFFPSPRGRSLACLVKNAVDSPRATLHAPLYQGRAAALIVPDQCACAENNKLSHPCQENFPFSCRLRFFTPPRFRPRSTFRLAICFRAGVTSSFGPGKTCGGAQRKLILSATGAAGHSERSEESIFLSSAFGFFDVHCGIGYAERPGHWSATCILWAAWLFYGQQVRPTA